MTGCSDDTPNIDTCADPAYRAAHPEECANFTVLVLQPEYALTEPGKNVTYTVILRANAMETIITKGLTFNSSNVGAAVINDEGVATGVTPGTTTISVQWQNLSAYAQLDVVGSCAETNQSFAILIDHSASMLQQFSTNYATKLSFSKETAKAFIDSINLSKDQVSVWKFGDSATQLYDGDEFGTNPTVAKIAVSNVTHTSEKTKMADALQAVIESFPTEGVRVIVMFTDGEWDGDDPHEIAQAFKDSGGFLCIVAVRSWGEFFQDMAEIASGGFFLSAYGDTELDIAPTLSGLKSFICSGSCAPEAITAPMAQLNYTGFINWDVTAGRVDLCGLGLYDMQPGHGLYADCQGTGDEGYPFPGQDFGLGQLTSKVEFDFEDGKDYSFSILVGGSLPNAFVGTWTIRVRAGNQLDEEITITLANTPFAPHLFEWTQSGDFTGPIIIEQTVQAAHHNVGTLIDDILLRNETDDTVMLEDSFDEENPTTIEPQPDYGYGCLSTPPGAQNADPAPPTPRFQET